MLALVLVLILLLATGHWAPVLGVIVVAFALMLVIKVVAAVIDAL